MLMSLRATKLSRHQVSIIENLRQVRHGPLRRFGPLWTLLGNLYRSALRAGSLLRPTPHRIGKYGPFMLHGEFAFSDFANWGGAHNRGFERCIEACRDKACVLDVGAHIGLVALPMSRAVADAGRVFAFEPATANLEFLRAHLALNRIANVTVVNALVGGGEKALVEFFEQSRAAGQNSVVVKKNSNAYRQTLRRQITLDGFCGENDLAPDVVKIDVEGGEIGVLEGARKTLAKHRPEIFLSVHPAELGLIGHSPDALARLIAELGYDCRDIDGRAVRTFRLDEYVLTPRSH